jgi:hypothetical protein
VNAFMAFFVGFVVSIMFLAVLLPEPAATRRAALCEEACDPATAQVREGDCWCTQGDVSTRITPKAWTTP